MPCRCWGGGETRFTGLLGGGGPGGFPLSFYGYLFGIAKIAGSGWNITIFLKEIHRLNPAPFSRYVSLLECNPQKKHGKEFRDVYKMFFFGTPPSKKNNWNL